MRAREAVILAGSASRALAERICAYLALPLSECDIRRFKDGEIFVEIQHNVRGRDVYIVQSTSRPVNETLMELLIIIDALKRASAKEITAVIPYYGYARQDRKLVPRSPISAKLVADLLTAAGTTRVVSMDLHAGQIQGFFNIPFDNLFATPVLLNYIRENYRLSAQESKDLVVVSPDAGGVERARALAKKLNATVAVIDKRRPAPNLAEAMHVIGEVGGKTVVILDDLIDTAGTLVQAARAVHEHGAQRILAAATHGLFSGDALMILDQAPIESIIVTDTITPDAEVSARKKIITLSVAELLAETIRRIHNYDSVSSLFI